MATHVGGVTNTRFGGNGSEMVLVMWALGGKEAYEAIFRVLYIFYCSEEQWCVHGPIYWQENREEAGK